MTSILPEIEEFLTASNMGASTFGEKAMKDRHLVRQLRAGTRRLWPETELKIRDFMASYVKQDEAA